MSLWLISLSGSAAGRGRLQRQMNIFQSYGGEQTIYRTYTESKRDARMEMRHGRGMADPGLDSRVYKQRPYDHQKTTR